MNATPHTLAGFTIVTAFQDNLLLGIPLAIGSHFALDFINESGLSKKERFQFDVLPSLLVYLVATLSGQFWLFLLGSICGNLLDIIDKKLYLATFFPSKYKSTHYFHLKSKPLINPKPEITMAIGFVSAIILILMLIY